jgi:predicted HicB family RNase H-like nuclease
MKATTEQKQEPKAVQSVALRLPRELHERIENAKWKRHKSINALIVEALARVNWEAGE